MKKLRKPTKVRVTVENLDRKPFVPPVSDGFRAREPERTATYWRNCYEAERASKELVKRHLEREREEVKHLQDKIESLSKTRRPKRRLS